MRMLETERERYADDGKPPLDWERYLEVAPALSGLDAETRDEALAAREMDGDTWSRAESYWTLTLALDASRGRTDRADAYGCACAAHLQASRQPDAREDTLPEAGLVSPPQATADAALAAPPAPAALPPAPAAVPSAVPAVVVPTFLRAADTPRAPGPVAVVIAPPRLVAPAPPELTLDATPAYRGQLLPFGKTASPAYAARLATTPAAPAPPAANRPEATVIGASSTGPALPFEAGAGAAPAPKLPDLTLEQHATLSAELAIGVDPKRRATVLAHYHIETTEALIALGAHWQARLATDPHETQRWKMIYAEQRARLQQESRRTR